MKIYAIIILVAYLSLQGCTVFSPVKIDPESVYLLNTLPKQEKSKRSLHQTLYVMPLETLPVYNTTQMAYTVKPYQIAYFAKNRWAETPAQMLQPLLVQALQNRQYYHAILTPPAVGRYDYVLSTQLLQLLQNYMQQPAVVQLIVRAQLSRIDTNQVMATKQFSVTEPIRQRTPYDGVIAANKATEKLIAQLTAFCLQETL